MMVGHLDNRSSRLRQASLGVALFFGGAPGIVAATLLGVQAFQIGMVLLGHAATNVHNVTMLLVTIPWGPLMIQRFGNPRTL